MNGFYDFLFYYSIYLSACAILYRVLIQNKCHPSMCRRLIIDIFCFSVLTVPLCKFIDVSGLNITPGKRTVDLILLIYGAGVIVFTILFIANFIRLMRIRRKSIPFHVVGEREVYLHNDKQLGCFSWYRYIFLPESVRDRDSEELNMILTHEEGHLYLFHWLDLVGINVFLIFQWFNPFVWYLRRELRQIHEYEADRRVLHSKEINKKVYEIFLVEESSRKQPTGLTSGLNFASLKQRILMMNKEDLNTGIVDRSSMIFAFAAALICLI